MCRPSASEPTVPLGTYQTTLRESRGSVSGWMPVRARRRPYFPKSPTSPTKRSCIGRAYRLRPQLSAVRGARERGVELADELALLTVHGVLHLLGHDHETPPEDAEMRELERAALLRVGRPQAARERA